MVERGEREREREAERERTPLLMAFATNCLRVVESRKPDVLHGVPLSISWLYESPGPRIQQCNK